MKAFAIETDRVMAEIDFSKSTYDLLPCQGRIQPLAQTEATGRSRRESSANG